MRTIATLIAMFFCKLVCAAQAISVFVSFSMPSQLLEETIKDATNHQVPVVLNGFYQDSMRETAIKLFALAKKVPNASIQIDPIVFERFKINQVPAWVLEGEHSFDVIFGNITFDKARDEFAHYGDVVKENR